MESFQIRGSFFFKRTHLNGTFLLSWQMTFVWPSCVPLRPGTCEKKGVRCSNTHQKEARILTAGERTVSDRESPSRSVTRLLDRKVLTGVTCGEGAGSTAAQK